MREVFPKGRRISREVFAAKCKACLRSYFWQASFGNRRCPHCRRIVTVAERPLLPDEERKARALVGRGTGGGER